MVIYLVRHTTPDVEKGVCYGQTDLDVTETFGSESEDVKRRLLSMGCSESAKFISSPLQRCLKLANALTDQPIQVDERLMETNFGEWEMQAWDDIDELELRRWGDDFVHIACPGGESYQMCYDRVADFFNSLQNSGYKEVVVVTHGGVIRAALTYLGKTTLETSFDVAVHYGDVFREDL